MTETKLTLDPQGRIVRVNEAVRMGRKVRPLKALQTRGIWGHAPPENVLHLGVWKCHFLGFPHDMFIK